jgi:hypothetical protein
LYKDRFYKINSNILENMQKKANIPELTLTKTTEIVIADHKTLEHKTLEHKTLEHKTLEHKTLEHKTLDIREGMRDSSTIQSAILQGTITQGTITQGIIPSDPTIRVGRRPSDSISLRERRLEGEGESVKRVMNPTLLDNRLDHITDSPHYCVIQAECNIGQKVQVSINATELQNETDLDKMVTIRDAKHDFNNRTNLIFWISAEDLIKIQKDKSKIYLRLCIEHPPITPKSKITKTSPRIKTSPKREEIIITRDALLRKGNINGKRRFYICMIGWQSGYEMSVNQRRTSFRVESSTIEHRPILERDYFQILVQR